MIDRLRIRPATIDDAGAYARLTIELATGDPPPTLERIAPLIPRIEIAERDGAVLGYALAGVEAGVGFLRQIVVDPAARRLGVGRALFDATRLRLRAAGANRLRLNVKADNTAAIVLYEAMGLGVDFRSAALWMTHAARLRLPCSTDPLALFVPQPSDDAAIERRFSLSPGTLAHHRATTQPSLAVRPAGDGETLAVMRFAPDFPGAYPFCAISREAARALLFAAWQAVPDAARYGLVVERDDVLADALVAAGATLRFGMLQMEGPV